MRLKNAKAREQWIAAKLRSLPAGSSILDVGAGECAFKKYCEHLEYTSQDVAEYDGTGNRKGLQTRTWDFDQIAIVCDLYDVPEDKLYDAVLCTEVLEHVTDPVRALEKISHLVKPGGLIIVTAPFCSLTHFAPYHYTTGFSEYFYRTHFERLNCRLETLEPNGGYFDYMDQELGRLGSVRRKYGKWPLDPVSLTCVFLARMSVRLLAAMDGPRSRRASSELLTFGWHVVARRDNLAA
jgi:SAM-dependent methyltransferase